jgi:hypothetical protein
MFRVICDYTSGFKNDTFVFDKLLSAKNKYNELLDRKTEVVRVSLYETSKGTDGKLTTKKLNENGKRYD